jgi:hypothetical protein
MARQREDMMDVMIELPWWFDVILAAVVYVVMRFVVPSVVGQDVSASMVRALSVMFAPWLAVGCLVAAAVSALRDISAKVKRASEGKARVAQGITVCPTCGGELVLRTASRGANRGNQFWGCSAYPRCRYTKDFTS